MGVILWELYYKSYIIDVILEMLHYKSYIIIVMLSKLYWKIYIKKLYDQSYIVKVKL